MPAKTPPKQVDVNSLDEYLEVMSKVVFQSGMSWSVVESKWDGIRQAFKDFDIKTVADFNERDLEELGQDKRVIRNHRKLAAIVHNAQRIIDLDREHGSFKDYLRSHGDFEATLKAMRKDFKFLGPFGVFYFLYVIKEEVPPYEQFQDEYGR